MDRGDACKNTASILMSMNCTIKNNLKGNIYTLYLTTIKMEIEKTVQEDLIYQLSLTTKFTSDALSKNKFK